MPFRAFPEQVQLVHEFYRLKVLITLEKMNTSVVEKKKKKNINQQNFNGEANWSVVEHAFQVQENGGTKGEVVP